MQISEVSIHTVAPILQSGAIRPLQEKKETQPRDVIKRALVKPQAVENTVENMMEMWHLRNDSLFSTPHTLDVFYLLLFFFLVRIYLPRWILFHFVASCF